MLRKFYLKWRVARAASISELCELKAWQHREPMPEAVQEIIALDRTPYEYLRKTEFPLFETREWFFSVPDWSAMKGMHSEEEDAQVLLSWLLQDTPREVFYSFCRVYRHIMLSQQSPLKKKLTNELKLVAFGLGSATYRRERELLQRAIAFYKNPPLRKRVFLYDDAGRYRDPQHLLDDLEVKLLLHR